MTRANDHSQTLTERLGDGLAGIPQGAAAAYRDAFSVRGIAWASPAVFTVGAYFGFYAIGLVLVGSSPHLLVSGAGVGLGFLGLLVGIGLGFRGSRVAGAPSAPSRRWSTWFAVVLLVVGLASLAAYFSAIGYIPLLQPNLEQSRVQAAEAGGAPLRVLSLLALPGSWILLADSVVAHDRSRTALAAGAVALVAIGFTLTGNRSPAFLVVEVALAVGLLAAGAGRLKVRGMALAILVAIVLVLGAGVFGAFRLASRSDFYGPPNPHTLPPNYPALTVVAIRGYLVVPVQNLGFTLDAIPALIGWRLGLTYVQPLVTTLPGHQTTFDADLKTALGQAFAGGGTVPGLLGEAFANFGPPGWFAVPLIVGFLVTILYRVSQVGTAALDALYGFTIVHVSTGGVISGLAVASIFPYVAYAVLGFAVVGLPALERRWARRNSTAPLPIDHR